MTKVYVRRHARRTKGHTYRRVEQLEKLARDVVGDSGSPNLYFVSDAKGVIMVTKDLDAAHEAWRNLPRNKESSLEDRKTGVLASTEPVDDTPGARLVTYDDVRRKR